LTIQLDGFKLEFRLLGGRLPSFFYATVLEGRFPPSNHAPFAAPTQDREPSGDGPQTILAGSSLW
jgi:hypothetical protein